MKKTTFLSVVVGAAITYAMPSALPSVFAASQTTVLRIGASGADVVTLQEDLHLLGYSLGQADGQFGPMTLKAVEAFQKASRLQVNGVVDAATWNAIRTALAGSVGNSRVTAKSAPRVSDLRKTTIYLNNKLISQPYAFTANHTTYMPIWYLKHMLAVMGISSQWNGTQWALTVPGRYPLNLTGIHLAPSGQTIVMNGVPVMRVDGIPYPDVYTHKDTEYMPIYYLQRALTRLHIEYHWNGTTWVMTSKAGSTGAPKPVPKPVPKPTVAFVDFGTDGTQIGTYATLTAAKAAIAGDPGATVRDNAGHVVYTEPAVKTVTYTVYAATTESIGSYTSLTLAKSAAQALPGGTVVDAAGNWVFTAPIPFAAYDETGQLIGVYSQLSQAEAAVINVPGANVEDSTGTVVYTQPSAASFGAYTSSGALIGQYSQLQQAEDVLVGDVGGTVRDANGQLVFTEPDSVAYSVYSPGNSTATSYPTLIDAEAATLGIPTAAVEDASGNTLYVRPITVPYSAYNASGLLIGLYAELSVAKQSVAGLNGATIKDQNGNVVYVQRASGSNGENPHPATDFSTVDLRYRAPANITASAINQYLTAYSSPLAGLGSYFVQAQNTYGVDANYLVSHAILESSWGKSQIALAKNNIFGYGAYDSNPGVDAGRFPSLSYAILYQAWSVRNNYLTPGAGLYVSPTLKGMNVHYASDPRWASSISSLMGQLANYVGDSVSSYPAYSSSNAAPTPSSTTEPIYALAGAQAVIQSTPNYGNLPYFPDWSTGESQMFVRTLAVGANGRDVATLQQALNQTSGAGLTVDGVFGPMTKTAVMAYQKAHGMSVTGQCTYAMWKQLVGVPTATVPAQSTVTVDGIAQGLAGGLVMEWYHIPSIGWVDSEFVHFTNVYRLTVANPSSPSDTSIPVSDPSNPSSVLTTLHAGDFVVSTNPTPVGGHVAIEVVNPITGRSVQGWVPSSQVHLTAIQ